MTEFRFPPIKVPSSTGPSVVTRTTDGPSCQGNQGCGCGTSSSGQPDRSVDSEDVADEQVIGLTSRKKGCGCKNRRDRDQSRRSGGEKDELQRREILRGNVSWDE